MTIAQRLIEQLEDTFAGRHRRLQNSELFAQILNRPEHLLRILHKCDYRAELERALQHAQAAKPQQRRHRRDAKEFDRRVEHRVRQNRIFIGQHVVAVDLRELTQRLALAIEQLHHRDAADVFLQEGIDPGDGRANAPVRLAERAAEDQRDQNNQRQNAKRDQRQPPIEHQHRADNEHQSKNVRDHAHQARGE